MVRPLSSLNKLLRRWSGQQEVALRQMTRRKTAGGRIAGYSQSERTDAKFFVLALAPFTPLVISDELGWARGALWHGWFWFSLTWAVVITGTGFAAYWRALRRSRQQG